MGLNHFNGRVQDAITGRFLSADPQLQDPSNTQIYNRFSYVTNNPLTFTDPTGFDEDTMGGDYGDDGGGGGGDVSGAAVGGELPEIQVDSTPLPPENTTPPISDLRPQLPEITVRSTPLPKPPLPPSNAYTSGRFGIGCAPTPPKPATACSSAKYIAGGAAIGATIIGSLYTAIALANLEDGAGEGMLALRGLQMARFGEGRMFGSDLLGALSGAGDVPLVAITGTSVGAGPGALGGALLIPRDAGKLELCHL